MPEFATLSAHKSMRDVPLVHQTDSQPLKMNSRSSLFALAAFCACAGLAAAASAPHPLNCVSPTDSWNLVASFDNSEDTTATFHYNQKIGTLIHGHGQPTQEQFDQFFQAFADIIGIGLALAQRRF